MIQEYELWSKPGFLLHYDYPKLAFPVVQRALEIPPDVLLPLTQLPEENFAMQAIDIAIRDGIIESAEFELFCDSSESIRKLRREEKAVYFEELRFGRPVAWIHLKQFPADTLILRIDEFASRFDLRLFYPLTEKFISRDEFIGQARVGWVEARNPA